MNCIIGNFIKVGKKYGFDMKEKKDGAVLFAKNTDGKNVAWIRYSGTSDTVSVLGNTDHCNLWFHQTRKDMTTDKVMSFVTELNAALEMGETPILLKTLIDPEDWQEIADIPDAYADPRYSGNK